MLFLIMRIVVIRNLILLINRGNNNDIINYNVDNIAISVLIHY